MSAVSKRSVVIVCLDVTRIDIVANMIWALTMHQAEDFGQWGNIKAAQ